MRTLGIDARRESVAADRAIAAASLFQSPELDRPLAEFDDYHWLIGDEADRVLEALDDDPRPLHQKIRDLRKTISTTRAQLATQQWELRRRGSAKFGSAARVMFFLPQALEQATDVWTARYKAARFPPRRRAADYCTGVGGDLCGLAERRPTVGCERDRVTALLAEENARRWPGIVGDVAVRVADAREMAPEGDVCWHLDPDRRAQGRRTTTIDAYEPGMELIDQWRHVAPDGVVKLAPASVLPHNWQTECETEWVSRARVCRQQLAWSGELATLPGQRRATRITVDEQGNWSAASIAGPATSPTAATDQCDAVLLEPDPAVIASGLVGLLAMRHNLAQLGVGSVYLTGPAVINDPLLASFLIDDALPLRTAAVRRYLQARRVGSVEVKRRGVDTDPIAFRQALKLRGDNARVLVLTRINDRGVALVCRRVE